MKLNEVKSKLEKLRPALSSKEFLPVMTCFCFKNKQVYAYDDLIAIRTDLDIPIEGAVRGNLLLEVLRSLQQSEVSIVQKEDTGVEVKAGKSSMKLPVISSDDFIFEWPDLNQAWDLVFEVDERFLDGLSRCLISASDDPTHPDRMGVTVSFENGQVIGYSTDNKSITSAILGSYEGADAPSIILPTDFCSSLLEATKESKSGVIKVAENRAYVIAELNDSTMFSKLVNKEPVDYREMIRRYMSKSNGFLAIPEGFSGAISRAEVIMRGHNPQCLFRVQDSAIYIETTSGYGSMEDELVLERQVETREASFDPSLVHRVLSYSTQFELIDSCLILINDNYLHLIATKVG